MKLEVFISNDNLLDYKSYTKLIIDENDFELVLRVALDNNCDILTRPFWAKTEEE